MRFLFYSVGLLVSLSGCRDERNTATPLNEVPGPGVPSGLKTPVDIRPRESQVDGQPLRQEAARPQSPRRHEAQLAADERDRVEAERQAQQQAAAQRVEDARLLALRQQEQEREARRQHMEDARILAEQQAADRQRVEAALRQQEEERAAAERQRLEADRRQQVEERAAALHQRDMAAIREILRQREEQRAAAEREEAERILAEQQAADRQRLEAVQREALRQQEEQRAAEERQRVEAEQRAASQRAEAERAREAEQLAAAERLRLEAASGVDVDSQLLSPWRVADGLMPEGRLGETLHELADEDVADACDNLAAINDMVYEAITHVEHQGLPAPQIWRRTNGDRLLAIAELPGIPCQEDLVKAALALATNIPNAAESPADFAQGSGLGAFCRSSRVAIRNVVAGETPWTVRDGWYVPPPSTPIMSGYAADLLMYCPGVLDTFPLKEVAVQMHVMRARLATEGVGQGGIRVRRTHVFADSSLYLTGPVGPLFSGLPRVGFNGEPGIDAGGVGRDWFDTVTRAVFESDTTDPVGGLFKRPDQREYVVLDMDKPFTALTRPNFVAVGRFLAFCLANRLANGAPLPRFFWSALLNNHVDAADVQLDDPALYREIQEAQRDGEPHIRIVLGADEDEEVPSVEEYVAERIASVYPAEAAERMAAIREGFSDVIPIETLRRNFSPVDIHSFVFGDPEINVDDLRANTFYSRGLHEGSQEIQWLWRWLQTQDNAMKRKYIQFITGLSQVPLGGFAGLGRRMEILPSRHEDLAPRSHTCFFQLELPPYQSYELLAEWMPTSLSSDGFGMG